MKKIILLFLFLLVLASCNEKKDEQRAKGISESQFQYNFKTLKQALDQGYGLECVYADESGTKIKAFIQGTSVKTMGMEPEDQAYKMLAKGQNMWTWDENKQVGSLTNLSNLNKDNDITMNGKSIRSSEDVIAVIEANRQSCATKTFSTAEFKVPANINIVSEE
ncbi:lipoprotein [Candidatus Beckwithbacteria bacterium]|nr:lipoprotein [Candidatus Beckwithbacteria bacterium]